MVSYPQLIRHQGNEALFLAIELGVIAIQTHNPLHLHVHGLRGTGKTTIIRAAKDLLPSIICIKGCLYNCDPLNPICPEHQGMTPLEILDLGTEERPMPLLEISHAAQLGTVVGSLDLAKLTHQDQAQAALLPGTLAQAHRGIVFVDEINRLADTAPELADVLLDLMGTKPGLLQIEEAGLPKVQLPLLVSVWAASNPDESPGPLQNIRKQLSDRFDCSIPVGRPQQVEALISMIQLEEQRPQPRADLGWQPIDLIQWHKINTQDKYVRKMAEIYIEHGLESVRALKAWHLTAKLHAFYHQKGAIGWQDLLATYTFCLQHRVDATTLAAIGDELEQLLNPLPRHTNAAAQKPRHLSNQGEKQAQRLVSDDDAATQGILSRILANYKKKEQIPSSHQAWKGEADSLLQQSGPASTAKALASGTSVDEPFMAPTQIARRLRDISIHERVKGERKQ